MSHEPELLLDVVVPVYNEEATLRRSIHRLHRFLAAEFAFRWRIVVADNASTDATPRIARALAFELPAVETIRVDRKGRGRALRAAWSASEARVAKREVISRAYNRLLRLVLRARFSDAQSGFKAVRSDVAAGLLPDVRDDGWFFDTELLILAQRRGLRIHEVPVDWVDDLDSRVAIVATALHDLRGVARLALAP